jgi:sec-independent protein translocase protein TatC
VILAAAITPSGDPVSLAALAVPMYIFYEIAVVIGRLLVRKKNKGEESSSTEPNEAAV